MCIDGDTWKAVNMCFFEIVHIEIQTIIMDSIQQDTLSVSKSIVW